MPVSVTGYTTIVKPRTGSMSTSRPSTSTWDIEADKVPLPDDTPSDLTPPSSGRPRAYTGPQYVRVENTDLQIYSRTGDSDIFSSAMGWSDAPRDMTRDPRPISERPFLQLDPGAFPFGRGVLYSRPSANSVDVRRSSLDQPGSINVPNDTPSNGTNEPSSTDTTPDPLASLIKYPTGVFQVLQTYRSRLPNLDVLLESNDTPTARLSTATSAVPENDPRFVIFGDLKPTSDTITASRRKITKPKPLVIPTEASDQRVMMAATIERWVAQLTSELNYDALLDFFLTYRAYVSANDLCHLLICRFHWALEPTVSAQDETVRRIVRVRTFIAFRYWLSTFFQVDFLPNRVLRNEFTAWLNALRKSPMLTAKPDAVKLRKIVRECREAHVARPDPKSPQSPVERIPAEPTPLNLHALRTAFEPSTLPTSATPGNDSDPDLVATTPVLDPLTAVTSTNPKPTPASPPRKSSLVLPFPRSEAHQPPRHSLMPMPMHHGPLTRALVNTMGRIGRWKRGLGARSTMSVAASAGCVDSSAYEGDLGLFVGAAGPSGGGSGVEVVAVRGGVEEYLKMCGLVGKSEVDQVVEEKGSDDEDEGEGEANDLTVVPVKVVEEKEKEKEKEEVKGRDTPTSTSTPRLASQFSIEIEQAQEGEGEGGSLRHSRRTSDATQMQLYATTLRDSWLPEPETISIDDADLSDSSSESEIVRRPPRRLPNRRDFEFATARTDSVSSLAAPSSVPSIPSVQSASDPTTPDHTGPSGPIQSWQIDFLNDEDSEDGKGAAGDAEAALQRLEGQIDAEEQRLRDVKVDKWLKRVQELSLQRSAGGREGGVLDLGALGVSFGDDEEEDGEGEGKGEETEEGHVEGEESGAADERESVAVSSQVDQSAAPSAQPSMRPSVEIPSEANGSSARLFGSNLSPTQDASSPRQVEAASPRQRIPMQFKKPRPPKDTSFLLQYRSEVIANNLSAIERGLFMAISFEELVMHNWGPQSHDLDITDWMQFRTDSAQHRIQPNVQKDGGRDQLTSDVLAVRARFNMTASFVASEVVMAHPTQRVPLVNKLIRIAWKLYRMNNFATLCAIITGLNSVWVDAAMRRFWSGVGMWELRVFKDLKWFVSSTDHFRFMRDAIVSATHDAPGTASDKGSDMSQVGCVPFLGIYLSELSEHAKLPDFIDPTRPEEPITLDPETGEFSPLRDPDVFASLPETPSYMPLRPLLNLHKQRQIAAVVKALVNGQHMASACKFTVEQKVYSRCLRLKCADGATLWRALAVEV
ncbi:hypothetical protein FRC09_002508 [Ceratobasidium sp. 395]|nr:hypothetical protein FRC09_002508 [Ceratobasidium sp. 395]